MNAGHKTDIAFGRHSTICPTHSSNRNNSDRTATKNHGNGDDIPGEPDDKRPEEDGPDDPSDDPDNSDDDVQHNLADAIAALAKNVKHQGDGSRSKV